MFFFVLQGPISEVRRINIDCRVKFHIFKRVQFLHNTNTLNRSQDNCIEECLETPICASLDYYDGWCNFHREAKRLDQIVKLQHPVISEDHLHYQKIPCYTAGKFTRVNFFMPVKCL